MSPLAKVVIALLVIAGIGGAIYWWRGRQVPPPPPPPIVKPLPPPVAPPPPPPDAAPVIQNPVEVTRGGPLPPLGESDEYVRKALLELLGRKGLLFLYTDGFVRKCVSTVDSLANEHAPLMMWPVNRTPGRFEAEGSAASAVIAERNAARYAAFVRFVQAVDTRRAAALYLRLYPLFQQAYEELGFPGKYFNDRLVEVIDHLLATPDPPRPIKVKLVEVPGAAKNAKPVYQFEDPSLESRSAGQKILMRMGRDQEARLKDKLVDLRRQIARGTGRAGAAQ